MKKISCITIIYLSVSIVSIAQISEVKILPIDGAPGDEFGQSVSISGDYAIVGARWDDDNGMMSGSAYIFQRDGSNWIEEQKLLATDGAEGDWFGHSVSISGDCVIVGAVGDDDYGLVSGAAYIFRREGTSWIEDQKLTSSDGAQGDNFGMSVSISGDYAILGAPFDDDNGMMSGSAYIFRRDSTIWLEEEKLTASDGAAEDLFGFSVSISGDYAIVGAFQDDDSGDLSGSAYIFIVFSYLFYLCIYFFILHFMFNFLLSGRLLPHNSYRIF